MSETQTEKKEQYSQFESLEFFYMIFQHEALSLKDYVNVGDLVWINNLDPAENKMTSSPQHKCFLKQERKNSFIVKGFLWKQICIKT